MNFSWLSEIFNGLLSFIPRPVIIRATQGGVAWRFGYKIRTLKPGWRWIWPLITEYEVILVSKQVSAIESQALCTQDKRSVACSAVVIFTITDIVKAIGERHGELEALIESATASAVMEVITQHSLDTILSEITTNIEEVLTQNVRKRLRSLGVYVHRCFMSEFAPCKLFKILGQKPFQAIEEN